MRRTAAVLGICTLTSLVISGCLRHANTPSAAIPGVDAGHYQQLAKQIEIPDYPTPSDDLVGATPAPTSLLTLEEHDYLELSLEETIHLALASSPVLRDLGGTLLRTPDASKSRFDPSMVETDPRTGIESALSAFDAAFTTNMSNEHNDRALNNEFFGGGTRLLKQNFGQSGAPPIRPGGP